MDNNNINKIQLTLKTYYYGIFGAIGGVFSWLVSEKLFIHLDTGNNIYFTALYHGAVIGAFIGVFINMADIALRYSLRHTFKKAMIGGVLGALSGSVGLLTGEFIFTEIGAGAYGRVVGWIVFGIVLGISDSINSGAQALKGALGGALGGLVGSIFLEVISRLTDTRAIGKAVGLSTLGFCIGGFVSLITTILMDAWIVVQNGNLSGKIYNLSKYIHNFKMSKSTATIGSNPWKANIYLPDTEVDQVHARIKREDDSLIIMNISDTKDTFVRNTKIKNNHILLDHDRIRVGNTNLIYHEKRSAKRKDGQL